MGLYAEFDVITDYGYTEATDEYYIIPDYSEGNRIFVETFIRLAREYVPVDTGYLQSRIGGDYDDTYCYIEADCDYAQYPEFGTWCQSAQPYFRPALAEALAEAIPYWDQAEEEAWLEEEMLLAEEEEEEQAARESRGSHRGGMGINTSSFMGLLGALLGVLIVAFITVTVQEIFGKDSSSRSGGRNKLYGGRGAAVFIPDIIIT